MYIYTFSQYKHLQSQPHEKHNDIIYAGVLLCVSITRANLYNNTCTSMLSSEVYSGMFWPWKHHLPHPAPCVPPLLKALTVPSHLCQKKLELGWGRLRSRQNLLRNQNVFLKYPNDLFPMLSDTLCEASVVLSLSSWTRLLAYFISPLSWRALLLILHTCANLKFGERNKWKIFSQPSPGSPPIKLNCTTHNTEPHEASEGNECSSIDSGTLTQEPPKP